jgi:LacI family transcriptional regulator, galactose operon repressor
MTKRPTIVDIAKALGVSTATVSRALHNHQNVTDHTKTRVLQLAKKMGFKPNLAARYLSSKRSIRISVNTLKGTTSFWNEIRTGIKEERQSLDLENVQLDYRTYPELGDSEFAAFEAALESKVDGIIAFPSNPDSMKPLMRWAGRARIPVVYVATDAPGTERLAVVSVDTFASGSLAADLMGRIMAAHGKVAVSLFDAHITEHAQKFEAFRNTMNRLYPNITVFDPIEDRDVESISYEKSRRMLEENPDLTGFYVTTEASMPVIRAASDAGMLNKLTIVTTDLFPELVDQLREGTVAATIYQRPRTQGRMAFRAIHQYLSEGERPQSQITFAPHLVMRGNLDFFLQRFAGEAKTKVKAKAR